MTSLSDLAGRTVSSLSTFAKHLAEEERALIVILLSCSSSLFLPRGILGWSAVCDCGISSSYSLSFVCCISNNLSSYASSDVIKTAAVAIKVKQPALSHQRNHGNMQN